MSHPHNPLARRGRLSERQARALLALLLTCVLPVPAGASPHPNDKVMAAVTACDPSGRELLERVVGIHSCTGDAAGVNALAAIYAAELKSVGAEVKAVAPTLPAVGNIIVAT